MEMSKKSCLGFLGDKSPINHSRTQKELKKFAADLLPKNNFRTYSQGIMDLGSMICSN